MIKRFKVLHVGQLIGGLDVYIRNSITNLNENIDFVVVRGLGDKSNPIIKNNKQIREYPVKLFRKLNPINDLVCIYQVIRIIRKEKPDLIHCHSAKGGLVGRIAGFLTKKKTLYTPHAYSFLSTNNKIAKTIYTLIERILKLNSYLLACSESERQMGINIARYKKNKALLWSNAVPDASRLQHLNKTNFKDCFACYIGRPSFQKNTFFLIDVIKEVIKEIPDFKIYLLGVGHHSPDLSKLKELIRCNELENSIKLIPWLSQIEALSYVKNACFYLSVSRYEGLPLSVLEAMALSKPLVVSDVSGNNDCVVNEVNGFLLPLDSQLFADKIVELWNSPERRDIFGQNSRERYVNEFHLDKQIKILEKIYFNLIGLKKD